MFYAKVIRLVYPRINSEDEKEKELEYLKMELKIPTIHYDF